MPDSYRSRWSGMASHAFSRHSAPKKYNSLAIASNYRRLRMAVDVNCFFQ